MKQEKRVLRFRGSAQAAEHRVRIIETGGVFDYNAPYSSIVSVKIEVPLPNLKAEEVVYVTAVDAAGNESDPLIVRNSNMAKINAKTLRFTSSASEETVEHRVRILLDGVAFDYNAPYSSITQSVSIGEKISVDIGTLSVAPALEGVYDVFVTAVDAAGNESDPMTIDNASFDFNPPAAPTEGEII